MPFPQITPLSVESTAIEGLLVLTMKQVRDERGVVREFYRESSWLEAGLPSLGPWMQVNLTESAQGVVRGLHAEQMTKLVGIAAGEAFGTYLDLRPASATAGSVVTVTLLPGTQVLVPAGVANGFQAVSPGGAQYLYAFDHEWVPGMAGTAVTPLDPALGITWPLPVDATDPAQLSAKDAASQTLADALQP